MKSVTALLKKANLDGNTLELLTSIQPQLMDKGASIGQMLLDLSTAFDNFITSPWAFLRVPLFLEQSFLSSMLPTFHNQIIHKYT